MKRVLYITYACVILIIGAIILTNWFKMVTKIGENL